MEYSSPVISDRAQLWLRLSMLHGIGPMLGRRLIAECGGIVNFWAADSAMLKSIAGVGPKLRAVIAQSDETRIEPVIQLCEERGIRMICPDDRAWPTSLCGLDDVPLLLFVQGDVNQLEVARRLSVVGARRASREGQLIARRWCRFFF